MQVLLEEKKNTSESMRVWAARNNILIYIDGICSNIPFGRLTYCGENKVTVSYHGFTDLVLKVDCILNKTGAGAENQIRSVSDIRRLKNKNDYNITCCKQAENNCKSATKASMQIQILYRQHASWQGHLYSPYFKQNRIPFRSVFELLHLMTDLLDIMQG